jgi:hypothetical protein
MDCKKGGRGGGSEKTKPRGRFIFSKKSYLTLWRETQSKKKKPQQKNSALTCRYY